MEEGEEEGESGRGGNGFNLSIVVIDQCFC
jgi:hypothetical protein